MCFNRERSKKGSFITPLKKRHLQLSIVMFINVFGNVFMSYRDMRTTWADKQPPRTPLLHSSMLKSFKNYK